MFGGQKLLVLRNRMGGDRKGIKKTVVQKSLGMQIDYAVPRDVEDEDDSAKGQRHKRAGTKIN